MTQGARHVLIVTTGGTIAFSPSKSSTVPVLSGLDLLQKVRTQSRVQIETVDLYHVMSESLTWDHVHELMDFLRGAVANDSIAGVVVAQGTDTLEEVAYLFDLVGPWSKPIVFTGAMRHNESLSADGVANLADAIVVAGAKESHGRGVLVVMNQEIHLAATVMKTHSTNVASFMSPSAGPVGTILEGRVRYQWNAAPRAQWYELPKVDKWPRVELIRMTLCTSTLQLDACLQSGVDGVVIEGFGAGHLPDYIVPWVESMLHLGIRIWVVPCVISGQPLLSTYTTHGSEVELQSMGVTLTDGPGHKARLLAMLEIAKVWADRDNGKQKGR